MRSFWSDPYLWIHVAGVAAVPASLLLCLLGFAAGDPVLPAWLELGIILILGIAPIIWMQWQQPFYIFSLLVIAIKPDHLTDAQRRLLTLFRTRRNPIWIGSGAALMAILLNQLYTIAPIASDITPISSSLRGIGLLVAAIGFLGANLFLQVPLSVLRVMLASDAEFAASPAFGLDQIPHNFSVIGARVNQILPPMIPDSSLSPAAKPSVSAISPEPSQGAAPSSDPSV
ncbi:low-complexity tail membrane protein [Myxacorys almedinensis]|uniref:Low-complexity tail membrane protein n=1 Tax=Myxacorys almedinensis A TaxID=2690445 RepID=A0A8J7Z4J3_9CYAN|nr:low-complexity tail membrane protein [Myxacorys almedinensis]NDJ19210.1 low-complexity tail membrane protein [Myxacorys almedinensis A]